MNTRSLQLQDQISDARAKLLAHPVYAQINDINGLKPNFKPFNPDDINKKSFLKKDNE
jgi:hypothetical protein